MAPRREEQWRTLVHQTAPMWLIFTGDSDEMFPLDLMVSLYRQLPNAELAVSPHADHFTPIAPEGAPSFAHMIRDFAERQSQTR